MTRKLNQEDINNIHELLETTQFITASAIRENLQLNCSSQTIRNYLHATGIHCRRPARKPDFKETHAANRLQFAQHHLHFDWSRVIFLDEKVFKTEENAKKIVWRLNGTRYDRHYIEPKRHSGRITAAYWGWMSADGPGEICRVSPRMNAEEYVDVLENILLPSVRLLYPDGPITLVQDNSSVHTSRLVRDWFSNNPEINSLPWPAKSPDLNPIENLWARMIHKWLPLQRNSIQELDVRVFEVWDRIRGTDICENLVNSMPNRLQEVINKDGWWTRY